MRSFRRPAPKAFEAPARALLLACLQTPPHAADVALAAGNLCDAGWARFHRLAAEQRVRPMVRAALALQGGARVPAAIALAFEQQCRQIVIDLLVKHGELAHIVRAFTAAGIPVIALKGACLSSLVYGDIALREMNDLDLLVPQASLQAAADILVARGFRPYQPFVVATDVAFNHHHLPTFVKGSVAVEIHWNVTRPAQAHSIDPADLWRRAVGMPAGSVPVLRLCLEDLLLHLCVHSSYQHQFECGLRPSCDIARLLQRHGDRIDWDAVCRRSEQWRWSRGVYVALAVARRLVGAAVPPDVLLRLQGRDGPDLIASAEALLWTTPGESRAFSTGVSVFGARVGWSRRIRHGWARMAPSRAELARLYSIQPSSRWLAFYYARQASHLIWTHGPAALRLTRNRDPAVLALAERRDHMRQWLLGPASEPLGQGPKSSDPGVD